MKNLTLLIFLIPIVLISQNLEPIQLRFYMPFKQDSVYLSSDSAYFQQTRFLKGNHWDNSARLGRVVGYNQRDIREGHDENKFPIYNNTLLHVKPDYVSTHCQGPEIVNARGIEYSPILGIYPNLTHTVQTISSSSRNPIFGFQTIVGTKDTTNDCLVIDSLVDSNTVILDEPWTADQFSSKSVS